MGSMYFMEGLPVRGEPPPASVHAASAIGSGSGSARGSRLCARVTVSPSDRRQLRSLLTGRFAPAAQLTSASIDDQETGHQELQRFIHLPEGRQFEEEIGSASRRERVCKYVSLSVSSVAIETQNHCVLSMGGKEYRIESSGRLSRKD